MAVTKKFNIDDLKREAKVYDPVVKTLAAYSLSQVLTLMKINLVPVANESVLVNARRKAGLLRPYAPGQTVVYAGEIGKFTEMPLKPELVVSVLKDNITLYKEKYLLSNSGETLDLKSKKHPLEKYILDSVVTSVGEDVIFSMFFAERDVNVASPLTAFNGFFPKLDELEVAGTISAGEKNLLTSGVFDMPVDEDDTDSYDKLVDWIGSGHPMLRASIGGSPLLYIAQSVIKAARAALRNKLKNFDYPSTAKLLEHLREDSFCPGLDFVSHECYGTGNKLILIKPGLIDFGYNYDKSDQYVQVRDPYEDPNDVQFWLESAYDTRFRDVHQKVFQTNEQVNTGVDLAGDYV